MTPKCCFFPDVTILVQFSPLLSQSFPFSRCPGKVLLCQMEARSELLTTVCRATPAVLAVLTFPSHLPTNTYICTFMGIFMRKSSLLFTSSLASSFSAKLKVPETVPFQITYGCLGKGWKMGIAFTRSSQDTAIFKAAPPGPSRPAASGSKPEQQLPRAIPLLLQCKHPNRKSFCRHETIYLGKMSMSSVSQLIQFLQQQLHFPLSL